MKETKFRRLHRDELEECRDQFVKFLGLNGIDAESWVRIKTDDPQRADALILQFSQTVFRGVIDRVEYLIHRKPKDLRTYKTGPEKIEMRGILLDDGSALDLTREDLTPQEMFAQFAKEGVGPKIYSAERKYRPVGRDQDIFLIMEEGALIDQGELFEVLAKI